MTRSVLAGLSALAINPMRSALSTLGVIIGVAALVSILSLGDGLERFSREQIENTTDLLTVTVAPQVNDRVDGILVRRENVPAFSRADVESLLLAVDAPARAFRVLTGSVAARPPDSTRDVGVLVRAVDRDAPVDGRRPVLYGSLEAWRTDSLAAVLSRSAAEIFLPGSGDEALGQSVTLGDRSLTVTAVLDGDPSTRPLEVFVPLDEWSTAWLSAPGRVPSIVVRAEKIEDVSAITGRAEAWADEHYPDGGVQVSASRARVDQASRGLLVFKLGLGSIAAISLLVGGIGIMNILLASVSERTREIGIRKAAGARSRDIRRQFLAESVAISGLGSILGIFLGMAGAMAATALIRSVTDAPVHADFTWQSLVVAAGAAIVIGLIFGTYPARKAARLSPIDAIRHE